MNECRYNTNTNLNKKYTAITYFAVRQFEDNHKIMDFQK